MISLIFTACVAVSGIGCTEHTITLLAQNPTPFSCMLYGQYELAKWDEAHPMLARRPGYKCGPASRFAKA